MPQGQVGSPYDDLPDGVVVVGPAGVVTVANPASGRILGVDPDTLVGVPLAVALPLIDPQGRDWWQCTDPFGGLPARVRQPERLLTLVRAGRDDRDVLVTASYVRDAQQQVACVVVCLRDTHARAGTSAAAQSWSRSSRTSCARP